MPSTRHAVAAAVLVALAGCSTVPVLGGGGGSQPTTARVDAPEHHAITFASDTNGEPFQATITVRRNGDRLVRRHVTSRGNGTYLDLATLEQPGPYTVTVNTTLTAVGGGRMQRTFEVAGAPGNATAVFVDYYGVSAYSVSLPRRELTAPVYFQKDERLPLDAKIRITHHGEVVYENAVYREGTGPHELTTLPETGVYRVSVGGPRRRDWVNETVVLRDPRSKLLVELANGEPALAVYGPDESLPEP